MKNLKRIYRRILWGKPNLEMLDELDEAIRVAKSMITDPVPV